MKTAQEVAIELNISRTEVYNLLRKKTFSSLVEKKGGQISINNKLFNLLKEEIENKKLIDKSLRTENSISNTKDKSIIKEEYNINNNKVKTNININSIQILKNQINLKDNQISILNSIITNNLKRINELENKQTDFQSLYKELESLKETLNNLTKRKNKKRIFGLF